MKTAGIAVDDWKLPIFKKHLDAAGFKYTEFPNLSRGVSLLKVETPSAAALLPIVEAAMKECQKRKMQ